jgi:3-phosphoshikimate 1-carboxyvinyltransferase
MFSTAFLDLPPLTSAAGSITLPGSKSISNRVLLLAALSHGTTVIHDLLDSDDTGVMLGGLRALGCVIQHEGPRLVVQGCAGGFPTQAASIFLGNAGTAMRPLAAVLAVLGGDYRLHGVARMHERPIGDLVDALRAVGCNIGYDGRPGYPPLHIGNPALELRQPIGVRGDVSSQFLTALLIALPLVASHEVTIEVRGELISRPYVEITLGLLSRFGVEVQRDGWHRFCIPAASRYRSPGEIHVEADASSASYFIALGAIAGGNDGQDGIRINGVGADSIQGDLRFVDAARMMGATVQSGPNWLLASRPANQTGGSLSGIDLDCNHMPDAAMTLAVMAMYARGGTTLSNIGSWRVKETDRIAAMATELRKFGANVEEGVDFLRIVPPPSPAHWHTAPVKTYDDHRMAMCFSLLAFNPAGLPVRIEDPKCVAKTYPSYFEDLFTLAHARRQDIPVICIDGPTASGKGTLAAALARRLGYHYLDSGALYRMAALAAARAGLALEAAYEQDIARLAGQLQVRFEDDQVWLGSEEVGAAIRTEEVGMNASRVSAMPAVRAAMVELQRAFRRLPGLVADGRDMGSVIFPDATLKVYLSASAERRAQRRHKQLISKGISANIGTLLADLTTRDERDSNRAAAPLKAAEDALLLDNSDLSVAQSVETVLDWWQGKQPFGGKSARG